MNAGEAVEREKRREEQEDPSAETAGNEEAGSRDLNVPSETCCTHADIRGA